MTDTPADAGEQRPDDPAFVDEFTKRRAAYIHIPFCARVCPYCDFAVVEGADDHIDAYIDALVDEIREEPAWHGLDSVFIGGGTPSHVDPADIERVLAELDYRFPLTGDAEITLEANPEDWTAERARALRAVGVNRVSLGAQSLQDDTLRYLGRRHAPQDVEAAVASSRNAGFGSVSVDLIYGAPEETEEMWHATLARIVDLAPDHVSAYALTVERGTPLSRAIQGGAAAPDDDAQADAYESAVAVFAAAGLVHYEVSNWARPGHACRYNLIVWAHGEYLGFGLGAHSYRDGVRRANLRRLDTYLRRRGRQVRTSEDRLSGPARDRERVFVGLRRRAGVELGATGMAWVATDDFRRLEAAGVVNRSGRRVVVRKPLLTDAAARSVLQETEVDLRDRS